MPRLEPPPPPFATPDECEQQFYEALRTGDAARAFAVWADDDQVACVHPGGRRLIGPASVKAGLSMLLGDGGLDIQLERVRRLTQAQCAVHHVVERVQARAHEGHFIMRVVATNVYVQGPLGWRLVLHHASLQGSAATQPGVEQPVFAEAAQRGARPVAPALDVVEDDADDAGPVTLH